MLRQLLDLQLVVLIAFLWHNDFSEIVMRELIKVAAETAFNQAVEMKTKKAPMDPPNISELMEEGFRTLREEREETRAGPARCSHGGYQGHGTGDWTSNRE